MDRVRFGRALGYGARHAAKTLMAAADAATAPDPKAAASATPRAAAAVLQSRSAPSTSAHPAPITAAHVASVSSHAATSSRNMASSVKRFSGAVMLQVVGSFFALFAFTFGGAVWRMRDAFHAPVSAPAAYRLYAVMLMCVVFGYFAASSFLRARKLEKS